LRLGFDTGFFFPRSLLKCMVAAAADMAVVVEDMAVVVDTLPVIWAALVVLAWRAAESAADMGMAAGPLVAA
jgi:hypothetical protein